MKRGLKNMFKCHHNHPQIHPNLNNHNYTKPHKKYRNYLNQISTATTK